jgi:ligand-binding SRPBCC domain-containing protein
MPDSPQLHRFASQQWLPWPVEVVFGFFAQPENLPRILPRWQKARIEEASFSPPPPAPASSIPLRSFAAGVGTRLTVSFRPVPFSPIRMPWTVRIAEFDWNNYFCDVQVEGPFASWQHCHHTRAHSQDGIPGTLTDDNIEYSLPLGPLGNFANTLVLQQMLRSTFAYRHRATILWLDRIAAKYRTAAASGQPAPSH